MRAMLVVAGGAFRRSPYEVQGHRRVLIVREKDLQRGLRKLLSNVVREKSGDAASFDGRGNGATNTIHHKAW
jgi:hypothetical protein